ncbi:MAG: chitobiase/beta-hexosaminidase C-terminal domain-containing protein [Muribaculaceae bacterium]|nr:chitobiase/beta-hexosaminidase C-terminal domain-containing protein [Muribaculaceae bacterium]
MGKLYSLISALLIAVGSLYATEPSGYEWWLDNDVSGASSGAFSAERLDLQIDTSDLPRGAHYFNCRFHTAEGVWGSVYRRMFYSIGKDDGAIGYEYWFDNEYDAKEKGSLIDGKKTFAVNVSSLTPGVHYFNCRLNSSENKWGTVYRKMVFTTPTGIDASAYEYWIDDKYNSKTEGDIAEGSNMYTVELTGLRRGLHRFNYRIRTGAGTWGSVYSKYFYIDPNASFPKTFEYWLDDDYEGRQTMTSESKSVSFNMDLSVFDKTAAKPHFFNLRVFEEGYPESSAFYRKLIVPYKGIKAPIIGYRHYLNDNDMGYVDVERQIVDSYIFDINLPDSVYPSIRNRMPVFQGDTVSIAGTDSINYTMQIRTELGWAVPNEWKIGVSNDFSATAVPMEVNSMRTFTTPKDLEFEAVKFTSKGDTLYFRSDVPVGLDIYKDGERVERLSHASVKSMTKMLLESGDYFGLLYEVQDSLAKDFTFHIMSTPNLVPDPEISFVDGTVTISCIRSDAEIHYTLDGVDPDEESTLYTEPFPLKRNAVVKALALVPGSDIVPSSVVELLVDSYKVDNPKGQFDVASRLLTLTCETKDASIMYSQDFNRNDPVSAHWNAYVDPIKIRHNGSVFVKGLLDGYRDSDIVEIVIDQLPNSVSAPSIDFKDGNVTISCETEDAEIHYTLDGSLPTAASTLYTAPFALNRNAVVKAIAILPDLDINPSEVAELVVDSYKVATPTGIFDVATRLLAFSCVTEGATISYTFDKEGEWTAYTTPISITRNCMVYARAAFDGYNDSDIAEIAVNALPEKVSAPMIDLKDGTVIITCETADAEIHYTLDGSIPTAASTLYTAPFALNRNAVVKAIAILPDLDINPSEVAELVVDSYKVATPTGIFDVATRLLAFSCVTEGATISYTFDKEGEWTAYTTPISITRNCVVYVRASLDGYNDSDITEIAVNALPDKVSAPTITFSEGKVTISCETSDSEIRYTIDGTNPTMTSTLYEAPFTLGHNAVVKAIAYIPGLDIDPSDVVTYKVDSYRVSSPVGVFDSSSRILTLSCNTEGASIFYSFDKEVEWNPYTGPVVIDGNCTVYAKATLPDFNDSDIAEIVISDIRCAGVSFSYNGRYMQIATTEPNARILYSIDGSDPSNGPEYFGEFDVMGICNVRAVAVKDQQMNSEIGEYLVDHYSDKEHAETSTGGLLESSFEWSGSDLPQSVESFRVEGVLNDADYKFLNSMKSLRHLDIEKVMGASIPARAFLNSKLISISLPEDLVEYGDSILSGATCLSSVIWNSKTKNPDGMLTDELENPNVILYIPSDISVANPHDLNIVTEGRATDVKIHYGFPYYAARDFHADNVSMTKEFSQLTEIGVCRGWETIVLPFKPSSIVHSVNGPAVPFAAWDGDTGGMKPFWLYSSTPDGWEEAAEMEACVPYIISMPNNPDYVVSSNLAGQVTFSATDVDLGPESSLPSATPWKEGTQFEGTFMPVEEEGILSLNVNAAGGELLPGSTFVPDGETVPFGAYVSGASARRNMPVFGDMSSIDLPTLFGGSLLIETPAPGILKISSGRERKVAVTTATGMTIRTLHLKAGETVTIEGLTRDLYIVGGVKVMVR